MAPIFPAPVEEPRSISGTPLLPGRAVGFRPKRPTLLRIDCGQVWVTLGEPDGGTPCASGDWFLGPGDSLLIPAGARMVMEAGTTSNGPLPAGYKWFEPVVVQPGRFAREVMAPAREVASALLQAGAALSRVFSGLLGYLGGWVGRGRNASLPRLNSVRS